MGPEYPLVSAIVPNWNGRKHVLALLRALEALEYPKERLEVIIVDNGSTDGSAEAVEESFERMRGMGFGRLLLIRNRDNEGAPAAYNRALAEVSAASKYIWKLDNDIVTPPNTLSELISAIEASRDIAGASGRYLNVSEQREDPVGAVFIRGLRRYTKMLRYRTYPDFKSFGQPLAMLSGGCCLFRRAVFDEVGRFDERFFLYFDDTEFCLRLVKRGYRFVAVPSVWIEHRGSASTTRIPHKRLYFQVRNLLLCGDSYFDGWERLLFHTMQILIFPWKLIRIILGYGLTHIVQSMRLVALGYMDFYRARWRTIDELR